MEKEDYLEVDNPIPGQNYTCISFVSPDETMKQKELYLFNKYMNQRCGELEQDLSKIIEKSSDELKNKIQRDMVDKLKLELKYTYDQFKSKYDDFKYKYNDELNTAFEKVSNKKTSVRGVKVRGVYDSYGQAEKRAKELQRNDRSFHVFVGQVGYWLPWDPNADQIQEEEYLESELNNLMGEYKKNEINRDIFYEDQKREKLKDAAKKLQEHDKENAIEDKLDEPDPWMNSRFKNTPSTEVDASVVVDSSGEVDASVVVDSSGEVDARGEVDAVNSDYTDESKIKTI
jgi:hypothetical protein